jgi:hypothetical protein
LQLEEAASVVPRHTPHTVISSAQTAELRRRYPHPARILWAMRLAKDVDTCAALLRNEPVDPACIHTDQLEQATKRTLVQLVAPIELFEAAA